MLFAPRQVDWADAAGNDDHRPSNARLGAQAIDDDLQGSFISAYAVMCWEGVEMWEDGALTRSRFGGART